MSLVATSLTTYGYMYRDVKGQRDSVSPKQLNKGLDVQLEVTGY